MAGQIASMNAGTVSATSVTSTNVSDTSLAVSDTTQKTQSKFVTSQGTIYVGSSSNAKFGSDNHSFILQTSTDATVGLSIGSFSKGQPFILGAANEEVITMKKDVDNVTRSVVVNMAFLPDADPGVAGQLYHLLGDLKVSF
jgi:hypothetical protein